GEKLKLNEIGKRASIQAFNASVFEGNNSILVYADLAMENNELRTSLPVRFEGYVQSSDGAYFPAIISAVKESVKPGAQILLSMSAELPKKYVDDTFKLIIGEGV